MKEIILNDVETYNKIKVLSNKLRYRIAELVKDNEMTVSDLSKELGLSYKMCSNYIIMLEKENIIKKRVSGRETFVSLKQKIQFK